MKSHKTAKRKGQGELGCKNKKNQKKIKVQLHKHALNRTFRSVKHIKECAFFSNREGRLFKV